MKSHTCIAPHQKPQLPSFTWDVLLPKFYIENLTCAVLYEKQDLYISARKTLFPEFRWKALLAQFPMTTPSYTVSHEEAICMQV